MTLLDPRPIADPTEPEVALAGRPAATPVCTTARLDVGRGVGALVAGRAVALFRLDPRLLAPGDHGIRAVDDIDPHSGASVLSRGLVGTTTRDGSLVHYVASPLRKQRFDLSSGAELDGPGRLATWAVHVEGDTVLVAPGWSSCSGNERETGP